MRNLRKKATLLLIAGLLVLNATACTQKVPDPRLYYNTPVTTDETTQKIAEQFMKLAEARLGKDKDTIDRVAHSLLTESSYQDFMRYYNDYYDKINSETQYIDISTYYNEAKKQFDTVKAMALEYGMIDENGNFIKSETAPAPIEAPTEQTQAPTEQTQAPTEQTPENDLFSDFPENKDGLTAYVDIKVSYVGEGDDIVEENRNRQLPFMLLGWDSPGLNETVEPITREQFDNATYEEMAARAKQIIYLHNYDEDSYFKQLSSDDRTDEQKQEDLKKSQEAYQKYLAYADKVKYEDDGDVDSDKLPLGIGSMIYDTNFANPETSSFISTTEDGKHVIYWKDIQDQNSELDFKVYGYDYSIEPKYYEKPIILYKDNSYSMDSWRLLEDPNSADYPTRVLEGVSSSDIKDFSLLIEFKLTPDNKVELTETQIKAILGIQR